MHFLVFNFSHLQKLSVLSLLHSDLEITTHCQLKLFELVDCVCLCVRLLFFSFFLLIFLLLKFCTTSLKVYVVYISKCCVCFEAHTRWRTCQVQAPIRPQQPCKQLTAVDSSKSARPAVVVDLLVWVYRVPIPWPLFLVELVPPAKNTFIAQLSKYIINKLKKEKKNPANPANIQNPKYKLKCDFKS